MQLWYWLLFGDCVSSIIYLLISDGRALFYFDEFPIEISYKPVICYCLYPLWTNLIGFEDSCASCVTLLSVRPSCFAVLFIYSSPKLFHDPVVLFLHQINPSVMYRISFSNVFVMKWGVVVVITLFWPRIQKKQVFRGLLRKTFWERSVFSAHTLY